MILVGNQRGGARDPHRLEQKQRVREVAARNLRRRLRRHRVEIRLRVEPPHLARRRPPGAARALRGGGARDARRREHLQQTFAR